MTCIIVGFVNHLQLAMGLGAVRLSKPTLLEKVRWCSFAVSTTIVHVVTTTNAHCPSLLYNRS